jgi:OOP family OmpA-OmpF porin
LRRETGIKEKGADLMRKTAILTFAVFVLLSFPCKKGFAEIEAGTFTVNSSAGWYVFDGDQDIYNGPVYGLGFGYSYTEHWGVEGVFNFINTETDPSDEDIDAYLYHIDGLYHFMPDTKFVPYLVAGGGAIDIDSNSGSDTGAMFNYGAGIKILLSRAFAVRGDVRHIIDFDDSNNNFALSIGLTYLFGKKEAEAAPPPPPPPEDSDGDGVYDDMDKCPDTPRGVSVDGTGCPEDGDGDGVYDDMDKCPDTPRGVSVDSAGCPEDSDGDGVYDYMDRCPHTPAGLTVDSAGCPKDSDGDGVYDDMDKCPDTLMGIKVDEDGCPVPIKEKVSIELKVEFEFDKAEIRSVYREHLQKVANFLKTYPDTKAVIEGHTDSIGTDEYNLGLSRRRAASVRRYLVTEYNIPHERLEAEGFGESMPIADNNTDEGRQSNRRVVAVISTIITKYE